MVNNLIITYDMMKKPLTAQRIRRERRTVGVLYKLLRSRLGVTQTVMGTLLGVSKDTIVQRERNKRIYSLDELVELQRVSGMSDLDWWQLIKEVAK
jgi:DNA-binding XRE family transcriptional regulator